MASAKEIKSRINSIRDTRKITNAMYLISSTKIKKARKALDNTRPYFESLRVEIKRIFRTQKDIESKYIYPVDREAFVDGDYGFLVITADKGLAGPYNTNVINKSLEIANEHNSRLYVVGEYGRQFFHRHNIDIIDDFNFSAQTPTLEEARMISKRLIDDFDEGIIKKLFVVYTDFDEHSIKEAKITRLLPFHREYFDEQKKLTEAEVKNQFEFTSNIKMILEDLAINYVIGFIFGALVESYTSELDYRMNAMSSANQNADKILQELTLEYNRLRQAAITQEITEVSAGARKMKQKRKRSNNEATR